MFSDLILCCCSSFRESEKERFTDFIVPGLECWFAHTWPSFPSQNRGCVNAFIAAGANEDRAIETPPCELSILKASLRQTAENYPGEQTHSEAR